MLHQDLPRTDAQAARRARAGFFRRWSWRARPPAAALLLASRRARRRRSCSLPLRCSSRPSYRWLRRPARRLCLRSSAQLGPDYSLVGVNPGAVPRPGGAHRPSTAACWSPTPLTAPALAAACPPLRLGSDEDGTRSLETVTGSGDGATAPGALPGIAHSIRARRRRGRARRRARRPAAVALPAGRAPEPARLRRQARFGTGRRDAGRSRRPCRACRSRGPAPRGQSPLRRPPERHTLPARSWSRRRSAQRTHLASLALLCFPAHPPTARSPPLPP